MTSPDPLHLPPLTMRWYARPESPAAPVVVTGAFDVLHVGHVRFLSDVRGRHAPLVVGVEDDARVSGWKGPTRPVNPAEERAEMLAALRCVDGVFIISGPAEVADWDSYADLLRPLGMAALAFTTGDPYTEEKRRGAEALGADAWVLPLTEGRSTSAALNRLARSL
ncbi:adenylyltransferase/cytidyltransferase family protein [Streptomonospora sp. S1-112]|uniref:Adenylyltransferase/cytidyltransferase family protein n=1 Tax=Streptomonospora mangrovi TaxID=2883123 RepID=A0A9X3SDK6_9ACTN|nr:adenylyltransferase/cytidyltransferase family protein [Streptomonospora mangrovi]MDA0564928.1 adenylyltransferase/cytidyltransferase family protein [Streptomonospora mangrovi]